MEDHPIQTTVTKPGKTADIGVLIGLSALPAIIKGFFEK